MDIEKLVQIITKEILKKINILEETKLKVLILSNDEDYWSELTKTALKDNCRLYNLKDLEDDLSTDDFDILISPTLTINELANLSLGICNCKNTELFLMALLEGKKVFQIKEGLQIEKYKDFKNITLLNLYKGYLKKLESFGARIISIHDIKKSLMEENTELKEDKNFKEDKTLNKEKFVIKNKKLFTESVLKGLYLKGAKEIVIDNSAIITSLADDFIRTKKLIIKKE